MKTRIKICSWNINGVKNKFTNDDVHKFLAEYDILCISESQFGIRSKCPQDFTLFARSKKVESKAPTLTTNTLLHIQSNK